MPGPATTVTDRVDDATGPTLRSDGPVTRRLFGFDFIDDTGVEATVERILGPQPDDGRLPLVATPNVDQLVRLEEPGCATCTPS